MSHQIVKPQEKNSTSDNKYVYIGLAIGALIGLIAYVQHWL